MSTPTPIALVLEDEREIRQFVRVSLEAEGWLVFEAGTVKQGLVEAATRRPDLVDPAQPRHFVTETGVGYWLLAD